MRSTLLLSSRAALEEAGLFAEYEAHLPAATRATLRELVAGTWQPVGLVMEHYAACDALGLSRATQQTLGRSNGDRLRGTLLGTLAKIAHNAGTTPATMVGQMPRFWSRIFDGGAFIPERSGPKDIRVRVVADPIFRSTYFRNGLAGTAESMLSLVATRLYVRVTASGEGEATYLAQWV